MTELVSPKTLCTGFPSLDGPQVTRDNMLQTLDGMLAEVPLVVVEGEQGIGKTTLLAQFVTRHQADAASLFVRGTSRYAFDAGILLGELCAQLHMILYGRELDEDAAESTLNRLIQTALRRRRRKPLFLVVDGLCHVPAAYAGIRDVVLDWLPFDYHQFRILLAGPCLAEHPAIRRVRWKSFPLPSLTMNECEQLLEPGISHELVKQVYQVTRGQPEFVAAVARTLSAAADKASALRDLPASLPKLFEFEWNRSQVARDLSGAGAHALAILAFSDVGFSTSELAAFVGDAPEELVKTLSKCSFLKVAGVEGAVAFTSEQFRSFARGRLEGLQGQVDEMLVKTLLAEPDSQRSLFVLPPYLRRRNGGADLIEYLSTERLALMLSRSQMRSPAETNALFAIDAALDLRRDKELVRLGLLSSELKDVMPGACSREELEALIAVNKGELALQLAAASPLRSDRLKGLAVIARKRREQGFAVEPELMDQITELAKHYEPSSTEEGADLAGDLLFVRSDLALQVLERAQAQQGVAAARLDWAYARVAVEAAASDADPLASEQLRSRIRDPELSKVAHAAFLSIRKRTAAEVISDVERVSSAADQMFLFRQWALHARSGASIYPVLKRAFATLLSASEISPNATQLRELSTPLPFVVSDMEAAELIATLDGLAASAQRLGPTEEFYRLQLIIARREAKRDFHAAEDRVIQVALEVSDLPELPTRAACLAQLAAALSEMDPAKTLEGNDKLHSLVESSLNSAIAKLLSGTAEHTEATRNIIEAVAPVRPRDGFAVARMLNTEYRRDEGLRIAMAASMGVPGRQLKIREVSDALDLFSDRRQADEALDSILARAADVRDDDVLKGLVPELIPLIGKATAIADEWLRAVALARSVGIVARVEPAVPEGLKAKMLDAIGSAWNGLDDAPAKVELGFRLATLAASGAPGLAEQLASEAETLRQAVGGHGELRAYGLGIRLAARAMAALLEKGATADAEMQQLRALVGSVPAVGERAVLAADIACDFYRWNLNDAGTPFVDEFVRPAIRALASKDKAVWRRLVIWAAPALFRAHAASGLEEIEKLPGRARDEAVFRILMFIARGIPPSEPYEDYGKGRRELKYENALDMLHVLPLAYSDALLSYGVRVICRAFALRDGGRSVVTREQRESIRLRLTELVDKSLPNPRFIAHDGYKIACHAELTRLSKGVDLAPLVASAEAIPNSSDSVFVAAIIADSGGDAATRAALARAAKKQIEALPSPLDRAHRLQSIAEAAHTSDAGLSKSCISDALTLATAGGPEMAEMRRSLVDFAFRMDPKWAESVASALDDDPARARARREIDRRVATRKLKAAVSDDKASLDVAAVSKEQLPTAAWMLLGGLNAQRIAPVSLKRLRECIRLAATLPLDDAYPVWTWTVENVRALPRERDEAQVLLRSIFSAAAAACDFARRLWRTASATPRRGAARGSRVVQAGDRQDAMGFLQSYLAEHARTFVRIADPFLAPAEIAEVLQLIRVHCGHVEVGVLTSQKHYKDKGIPMPWEDEVEKAWRATSDQPPPKSNIVIAGLGPSGDSPIHDRWWIVDDGGLRLGTSLSGLGQRRVSEVVVLTEDERTERLAEIDECLGGRRREQAGEKIRYVMIPL